MSMFCISLFNSDIIWTKFHMCGVFVVTFESLRKRICYIKNFWLRRLCEGIIKVLLFLILLPKSELDKSTLLNLSYYKWLQVSHQKEKPWLSLVLDEKILKHFLIWIMNILSLSSLPSKCNQFRPLQVSSFAWVTENKPEQHKMMSDYRLYL